MTSVLLKIWQSEKKNVTIALQSICIRGETPWLKQEKRCPLFCPAGYGIFLGFDDVSLCHLKQRLYHEPSALKGCSPQAQPTRRSCCVPKQARLRQKKGWCSCSFSWAALRIWTKASSWTRRMSLIQKQGGKSLHCTYFCIFQVSLFVCLFV